MGTRFVGSGETVYTDGSCKHNGSKNAVAGIGVYFGPGDERNLSKRLQRRPDDAPLTNQIAELKGCLAGLRLARGSGVRVMTDSEYVVKSMTTWAKNWEKNGWKGRYGKPIANQKLMRTLYCETKERNARFFHVAAHRDVAPAPVGTQGHRDWSGNREADALATRATV